MPSRIKRSTKRLLRLALLPVAVVVLGTLYMLGMDHLEGTPRTFLESIQWASETLTTTGYGADNRWKHPVVALFVIVGQFIGPRASSRISPPAEGMHMLGTKAGLAEFRVRAGSPLAARRLGDLQLREQQGVTVIGQWHGGVFATTRGPGAHPFHGDVLARTGAELVAVERGQEVLVEFEDGFLVRADDAVIVCGAPDKVERYQREFHAATAPVARA